MGNALDNLQEHFRKIHRLSHLAAMGQWDQAAMMPPGGNQARSEALAELAVIIHREKTHPQVGEWLDQADSGALDTDSKASLREMRRVWQQATVIPEALVQARSLAGSACEHAWRTQRKENDWQGFAVNLETVVKLSREEAQIRAESMGCSPYDALLDLYEPGMSCVTLDRIFSDVKSWLPSLIQSVCEQQKQDVVLTPKGPFAIEKQAVLGRKIMTLLGFDFDHGRLDVSVHPFCGGVPEDVRITTRYNEDDFTQALMGVIHETGHARYEQNRPAATLGLPVSESRSMGVHESQSLFFEMQLGRSPAFLSLIAPWIVESLALGDDPALDLDNLCRIYNRVSPGFIRVDADEVTYPAHIILRYEIERDLVEGRIEVGDIPGLWDEKMQASLGLDTQGNHRDGCMQDIHWTDGSFGYFPSYTLGAMVAAQLFAVLRRQQPDVDAQIREGNLQGVFDWLRNSIWQQGSRLETDALIQSATGEALNPAYFRQHLEQRYLKGA
ncbi:carboxypeptidase M32 [Kistimonas asteriae]|uniref:carboxypeptidase M32 n=1 Tax=Kistimonas asteriae TaxID=517724 RepID=UPI001BA9F240|nr:carboxypeptidase M32 [Kistimonas asteriae]